MNLSEINKGQVATIQSISASELRSKLLELGFVKGKEVSLLFHAPFGDPLAVSIDGYILSLRKSEAQLIQIEVC